MKADPLLRNVLKDHGHKVTRPRTVVFAALQDDSPQTMNELIGTLQGKVDRVSIYRIIELFEQLGIVKRIPIGWKYKIELGDIFSSHHHHVTCLGCQKVVAVHENTGIERLIKRIGEERNFRITSHQLELQGYCSECSGQI